MDSLSERDKRVIWHPYTQMQLSPDAIAVVRGEGAWLYDEAGNKYFDAISSWWVNLHGHAHPYIAQKVSEQLKELEHVIFAGFTHRPAIELAERLLAILPGAQQRVYYSDDGSTSVEIALKMALQYWHNKGQPKTKVVALQNAYHGDTFGAMSVSGRSTFTQPFAPLLFEVLFIETPVAGREEASLQQLRQLLDTHSDVAAFIFEPLVQGTAGMVMYQPEALDSLLEIAKQHDIITIADEVMTGFGRTGKTFASDWLVQRPDIFCLSKGLTGGTMPMGITTCTAHIYNAFLSDDRTKALFHGHSYTANPIACAASLASLDLLMADECQGCIQAISKSHSEFAEKLKGQKHLKSVRSLGTILAFEVEAEGEASYFSGLRDYLYQFFLAKGILMRPLGNILYLIPPYCISMEELAYVYNAIEELLEEAIFAS